MTGMEPMMIMAIAGAAGGTATTMFGRQKKAEEEQMAAGFEVAQLESRRKQYDIQATSYGLQAKQAEEQARQFEVQEQGFRTAAAQAETGRREELTSSLETIDAFRAARGVGLRSGTGTAIMEDVTGDALRDIRTEKMNFITQQQQSRSERAKSLWQAEQSRISAEGSRLSAEQAGIAAEMTARRGRFAGTAATIGMVGDIFGAAERATTLGVKRRPY